MASDAPISAGSDGASLADALRAGNRAFEAHDYVDAARHYARVVAVDGRCASAWYRLGNARWRRGDRTGAIEAYRRAVGEEPRRARAWQNLSTVELSRESWSEAADAAAKAVSLDPRRSKAWNNLAVARFAQGDRMGAETALRRALEVDPGFAVAWANLGRLLAELRRPDAARVAYEKALSLGETDAEVRLGLAKALVVLGDAVRAEAVLHDAVRLDPLAIDAWLALGDVRRSRSAPAPALEAARTPTPACRARVGGRGPARGRP
jgi:tetratricopeptide (TPR) repeat protein